MTITNGYATSAEFLAYCSVRGTNATTSSDTAGDDAVIEDIIEQTSRYIDGICERHFYTTTDDETRYYTAEDPTFFFIDDLTSSPTSVKVDYTGDRAFGTTIASSDFDMLPANAALSGMPYDRLEMRWSATDYFPTSYRNSVQVIGKFGFATVPDDIKSACLAIALNVYNARIGQSSSGNVTVTAAGVVIRPQDVPELVMQTLAKYRRYV